MMKFSRKLILALCLVFLTVFAVQSVLPEHYSVISAAEAAGKIKLNKKKATINTGEKLQLKVEGTDQKVKWASSNKAVATVSKKGLVKGKKAGKATITATVGKKTYKCKVTVKNSVLSADRTEVTLEVNKNETVTITYRGDDGSITWDSSDEKVATCNWEDGGKKNKLKLTIYGIGPGNANITVKDEKKNSVKIHVTVSGDTTWNYDRMAEMLKKVNATMENVTQCMDYTTKAVEDTGNLTYRNNAVKYFIEAAKGIKECRDYAQPLDPIGQKGKTVYDLLEAAYKVYDSFDSTNTTIAKLYTAVKDMSEKFIEASNTFVAYCKEQIS